MNNGISAGALQLKFGFGTQGTDHAMQVHLGPITLQVVMTIADADRICADWRKAIDAAKSPIQVVGGGIIKPG